MDSEEHNKDRAQDIPDSLTAEEDMDRLFGSCTDITEKITLKNGRKRKRSIPTKLRTSESSEEESLTVENQPTLRSKNSKLISGVGTFKCKHCSFLFPTGKNLKRHLVYHEAEVLSECIKNPPKNENEAVRYLQEKNVLPSRRICHNGHNMVLVFLEGAVWKCKLCKVKVRMRTGNWFEGKRMPLMSHLCYMKSWCEEVKKMSWWQKKLDMVDWRAAGWRNILREVCVVDLTKSIGNKIGGADKIVELDKTFYFKTNNTGEEQWVFGGVCRETSESFMVLTPDRSIISLINEILTHVKEGTILYSNSWRSHCMNSNEHKEFHHLKAKYFVSHKFHFVDLESGGSITEIKERIWGSDKWRKEEFRGKIRYHLESYLVEFMWALKHKNEDTFEAILGCISRNWPPEETVQISSENV